MFPTVFDSPQTPPLSKLVSKGGSSRTLKNGPSIFHLSVLSENKVKKDSKSSNKTRTLFPESFRLGKKKKRLMGEEEYPSQKKEQEKQAKCKNAKCKINAAYHQEMCINQQVPGLFLALRCWCLARRTENCPIFRNFIPGEEKSSHEPNSSVPSHFDPKDLCLINAKKKNKKKGKRRKRGIEGIEQSHSPRRSKCKCVHPEGFVVVTRSSALLCNNVRFKISNARRNLGVHDGVRREERRLWRQSAS